MADRHAKASSKPKYTPLTTNDNVTCYFWKTGSCLKEDSCDFAHYDAGVPSAKQKQLEETAQVAKSHAWKHDKNLQSGVHTVKSWTNTQSAKTSSALEEAQNLPPVKDEVTFPKLGHPKASVKTPTVHPATRKSVNASRAYSVVDITDDEPLSNPPPSTTSATSSTARHPSPTKESITPDTDMELLPGFAGDLDTLSEVKTAMRMPTFKHDSALSFASATSTPFKVAPSRVDTAFARQGDETGNSTPIRRPPGLEHITPKPPLSDDDEDAATTTFFTEPSPTRPPARRLNPNAPQYTPRMMAAIASRAATIAQISPTASKTPSHTLQNPSSMEVHPAPPNAILPTLPYSLSESRTFRSLHLLPESGLPKVAALPPTHGPSPGPIMVTIGKTLVVDPHTPHKRPKFHNQAFRKCVLVGCNLSMCYFDDCVLVSCTVEMSQMWHGTAWHPNDGADAEDYRYRARAGQIVVCEGRKCDLRHCEVRGGKFTDSLFGACELVDVDLRERCRVWNRHVEENEGPAWSQYQEIRSPARDRPQQPVRMQSSVWERPQPVVRNEWQERLLEALHASEGTYGG